MHAHLCWHINAPNKGSIECSSSCVSLWEKNGHIHPIECSSALLLTVASHIPRAFLHWLLQHTMCYCVQKCCHQCTPWTAFHNPSSGLMGDRLPVPCWADCRSSTLGLTGVEIRISDEMEIELVLVGGYRSIVNGSRWYLQWYSSACS